MSAHNALSRLAAVAPNADPALEAGEEGRILERILSSPRPAGRVRSRTLLLVGVAGIGAAAIAVSLGLHHSHSTAAEGRRHVALTGARIQLAGYEFRTPAGFRASDAPCAEHGPLKGFSAASADGACVEAAYLMVPRDSAPPGLLAGRLGSIPADAVAISIGKYSGYYVTSSSRGDSRLYVHLPDGHNVVHPVYLVLLAKGLTRDQLVAVALSGLSG